MPNHKELNAGDFDAYIDFDSCLSPESKNALLYYLAEATSSNVQSVLIKTTSNGGNVRSSLDLYRSISEMALDVTTFNGSNVDSSGVNLYLSGQKRFVDPKAKFLLHGSSVGSIDLPEAKKIIDILRLKPADTCVRRDERDVSLKDAKEILQNLTNDRERIGDLYKSVTNIQEETIEDILSSSGPFIPGAKKSIEYGLAHEEKKLVVPKGLKYARIWSNSDGEVHDKFFSGEGVWN